MLTTETCSFCNGRKVADALEESHRGTWVRPDYRRDPAAGECAWQLARAGTHPHIFRVVDSTCPRCNGRGEYEIEHFRGPRIF